MAAEPFIEEVLEHGPPDLRLVPDWAPQPDPEQIAPGFGIHAQWSDVWDWVKNETRHLIPQGRPIDLLSQDDVQAMIDASAGTTMKALSGYIDQNAAMTIQAAGMLEGAVNNLESNALHDYHDLSTRIDALVQGQAFIAQVVVPTIRSEIAQAQAHAYGYALAAQQNAEQWSTQNIFKPLYTEVLKVQPAIDNGVARAEKAAHVDAVAQVAGLGAEVGAVIGPIRNAIQALQTESEECTQPMCETMGPKTDLGKLLKGLKIAAFAALVAELAALDKNGLENVLHSLQSLSHGVIDEFADLFVGGGSSLGATVTATGAG